MFKPFTGQVEKVRNEVGVVETRRLAHPGEHGDGGESRQGIYFVEVEFSGRFVQEKVHPGKTVQIQKLVCPARKRGNLFLLFGRKGCGNNEDGAVRIDVFCLVIVKLVCRRYFSRLVRHGPAVSGYRTFYFAGGNEGFNKYLGIPAEGFVQTLGEGCAVNSLAGAYRAPRARRLNENRPGEGVFNRGTHGIAAGALCG